VLRKIKDQTCEACSTSGIEDFQWMIRYLDTLDETNAKILEGLGAYGPRNISSLAKKLKMSTTTVALRISKLTEESDLKVRARLNFQKLGLQRAVIFTEAKPGKEKILRKIVENFPYWTYIMRCFGKFNGLYAIFSFPSETNKEFEEYFKEASKQNILADHTVLWVTDFCEMPPSFRWFGFEKRRWNFKWQRWLEEIKHSPETLPKRLFHPERYPILVDCTDLLILKELEKDGTIEFNKLAKIVDMTAEAVRYRFQNHIQKRGLIADYEVAIFPYPHQSSDMASFAIDFKDQAALGRFVNSLKDKPFVLNYAKALTANRLIAHVFIPKVEFSHFIDSLNKLIEMRVVERYFHIILDVPSYKRQTVDFERFERNKWTYNHRENLEALKKALR
jgi:DNA-binding Lrp family transcriptional regulator